jgi:F-type H+-transporting ATPase subunit delta
MKQQTLIQEYGRAIYALGENEADGIMQFFETVNHLVHTSKELDNALNHPLLTTSQKIAVLLANVTGPVPRVGLETIKDLVAKRRMVLLPEILDYFRVIHYNTTAVVEVVITSVFPLPAEKQRVLVDQLAKSTGKKVVPRFELDGRLIGGLTVKIGDLIIDNSVKTEINQLKMRLLAPSLGQ